jgi:hypothetical protein
LKQVAQNFKTGEIRVLDVPVPSLLPGCVLVRVEASVLSAGTEKSKVDIGRKSLIGKAQARPDLVRQVLEKARTEGVAATAKTEGAAAATAHAEAQKNVIRTTAGELQAEWGQQGTPGFNRNMEMARRAIRMADPKLLDALKQTGAVVTVDGKDNVVNATLFKAFAKMGAGMYAEDSLFGSLGSDGKNPFDDKTTDLAMQGRFMREEPEKAISMIRAAGKEKMFAQFIERKGKR